MPAIPNPRHERFAQELAKGKTADEAYVVAGYAENRHNASRLKTNEHVLKRVQELQTVAAERAEISLVSILAELEEARQLALKIAQPAAMVAASMGRAKLSGLVIDRSEVGKPGEFEDMDEARLRAFIAEETAELGLAPPLGRLN